MERFGKAPSQSVDIEAVHQRVVNSGIKDDRRIYSSLTANEFTRLKEEHDR